MRFESSVNSYDSQTIIQAVIFYCMFESSVNSYDSQTKTIELLNKAVFESSVNSYDSQTENSAGVIFGSLRVV